MSLEDGFILAIFAIGVICLMVGFFWSDGDDG